jgi:hypothetical protein
LCLWGKACLALSHVRSACPSSTRLVRHAVRADFRNRPHVALNVVERRQQWVAAGDISRVGGDSVWLLLIGVTIVAALFILPRMMRAPGVGGEKRKNDDYDIFGKPKRDEERTLLTDDGEVLHIRDDESDNFRDGGNR